MSFQAKMRKVKASRRRGRLPLSKPQVQAVRKIATRQMNKRSELKYKDLAVNLTEVSSDSPLVSALTFPSQGDTITTRDGDSIWIKSSHLKGYVQADSTNPRAMLRVLVVQWLENSGTAPTLGDILEDTSFVDALNSPYKVNGKAEFRVLMDNRFSVSNLDTGIRSINKFLKPKVRKIQFDAGATTCTGQLYLMAVSDETAAGGLAPFLTFYHRYRYYDN